MKTELTQDASNLLIILYNEYRQEREKGISKERAKWFGSSHEIQRDLMQKWSQEDTDETCRELDRAGMLYVLYADNIAYENTLTDKAIIHMENRFMNNAKELLDVVTKIKKLVLF